MFRVPLWAGVEYVSPLQDVDGMCRVWDTLARAGRRAGGEGSGADRRDDRGCYRRCLVAGGLAGFAYLVCGRARE